MATRIVHQLIDDLDGSELADGSGETVLFALDGRAYEIDLSVENAAMLREALAPFISAGRRAGKSGQQVTPTTSRGRRGSQARAIREWAKSQGIEVPDRGRVPNAVVEQYNAAN